MISRAKSKRLIQLESVVELVTLLVGQVRDEGSMGGVILLIVLHFLAKVSSVCLHKHSKSCVRHKIY